MFTIFCLIVFSKIAWYDLRVYVAPDWRRDFLTAWFVAWVGAQILFYAYLARPLLREARRQRGLVGFWTVATLPYFAIGLLAGRVGVFYLGDLAHYAMPVGFLLYFCVAVRKLNAGTMMSIIAGAMAFYVALRLVLHLYITPTGIMRYGVPLDVYLVVALVAVSALVRSWRLFSVSVGLMLVVGVLVLGLSRSVLLGSVIGAGLTGMLFSLLPRTAGRGRVMGMAAMAVVVALGPMVFPPFERLDLTALVTDSNLLNAFPEAGSGLESDYPSEDAADLPERNATSRAADDRDADGAGATERGTAVTAAPDSPDSESPDAATASVSGAPSHLERQRERWEETMRSGRRSMDSRIAEAEYFLRYMGQSPTNLMLGTGAGWSVSVSAWGGTRIVRGAHVTYITLVFRHGLAIGLILILFVACYGLPENFRQLLRAPSTADAVFLSSLIAYRIAAVAMAVFHQGLFDDPLIFLSIAVAVASPRRHRDGA